MDGAVGHFAAPLPTTCLPCRRRTGAAGGEHGTDGRWFGGRGMIAGRLQLNGIRPGR